MEFAVVPFGKVQVYPEATTLELTDADDPRQTAAGTAVGFGFAGIAFTLITKVEFALQAPEVATSVKVPELAVAE